MNDQASQATRHRDIKRRVQVNTVVYVGDSRSREVIRRFEFDPPNGLSAKEAGRQQFEVRRGNARPLAPLVESPPVPRAPLSLARGRSRRAWPDGDFCQSGPRFVIHVVPVRTPQVLITTYELILKDANVLSKVRTPEP